jgi:2-iminobutanoate/2-iminopropanoate deaminase
MTRTTVPTDRLMRPIAEFSLGLRTGDVIHIGATAGTDARRELAGYGPGRIDVAVQASRMFDNMKTALGLLGGKAEDVVRVKGYVDDVRDFAVYEGAVAAAFPARSVSRMVVGSKGFPLPQAVVEADLVAIVGGPAASRSAAIGGRFHCTALPRAIPGEALVPDIALQTDRTFRQLSETLGVAGLSLSETVMLTVTLADVRAYAGFEETFRRFFSPPYPARTVVGAPLCAPDLLIGVECVAVAGGGTPIAGRSAVRGASSPAMLAGDMLHVGGTFGIGGVPAAVETQTVAAWEQIEALLEEAGMALDDVVSTTNVLVDWRDYRAFNSGFARFVKHPYPPRTTANVGLLDPRARVQIEATAHRGGRDAQVIEVAAS